MLDVTLLDSTKLICITFTHSNKFLSLATCEEYRSGCDTLLKTINIPFDVVLCDETSCKDPLILNQLISFTVKYISSIKLAS